MRALSKRIAALEAEAVPEGRSHMILKELNWNEDLVLDHYGREKIGPNDTITWVLWRGEGEGEGEAVYPAGFFDQDGRWAQLCAKYGVPHRDHGKLNRYLETGGWSDVQPE
jgi:hypothetical protein